MESENNIVLCIHRTACIFFCMALIVLIICGFGFYYDIDKTIIILFGFKISFYMLMYKILLIYIDNNLPFDGKKTLLYSYILTQAAWTLFIFHIKAPIVFHYLIYLVFITELILVSITYKIQYTPINH